MNDNLNINDSLQQVPQLKGAIDDLRGSIVSLNKEMLNYNKQNQEAVTWGGFIN